MTNLKTLTDQELDAAALVAAKNERLALVVVLEHLAEVDRRKTFSPRFESLEAYVIEFLGYDSKSAWRRVCALRLLQELPKIATAIESGKLDLTKIVLAQSHFRNEAKAARAPSTSEATISFLPIEAGPAKAPLTKAGKVEVLNCMMAQTSREAQRSLISKSSAPEKLKRPDLVKPLVGQSNEVRLVLTDQDLALVRELRGLLAHKSPNASVSEIVSAALKEAVSAIRNQRSGVNRNYGANGKYGANENPCGNRKSVENKKRRAAREPVRSEGNSSAELGEFATLKEIAKAESTRCPGAALKRNVWNRAGGKCEICGSRFALEYDHRIPFASGGKTTFENLRLTCRNCNQRESIKIFGPCSAGR